ncbi:MAG: hypothetical protein U0Y10_01805 [Spirosomataceae bacterium]
MKKANFNNKNKRFLLGVILSVLLLSICIVSCKDGSENGVKDVLSSTPVFGQSSIKFDGIPLNHMNLVINSERNIDRHTLPNLFAEISERDMVNISTILRKQFGGDLIKEEKLPFFIAIYTSNSMENVVLSDIKGISYVIEQENGNFEHIFFEVVNGKFIEDKRFRAECTSLKKTTVQMLANTVFENDGNIKWVSLSSIFSKKTIASKDKIDNLTVKVTEYANYIEGDDLGCQACFGGNGYCTYPENQCISTDPPGDCEDEQIQQAIQNEGLKATEGTMGKLSSLNSEKAYSFRDNFLKKFKKGNEYIDYYYKISRITQMHKGDSPVSLTDKISLAFDIYQIADALQSEDDEVIVSDEMFNRIHDKINSYREYSNNEEFQKILSNIDKDFKIFKNKKKSYILKALQ